LCGPNPLPGYGKLEHLCKISNDERKFSISSETRDRIIETWNNLEDHDRSSQNF